MGALSRLIAKELSSAFGLTKKVKDIKTEPALGIVDNPKYNPAFKEKPDEKLTPFDEMSDVELGYSDEELGFDDYSLTDDDVLDDIDLFDEIDEIGDQARLFEDNNTVDDPREYLDADGNPMLDDLDYDSQGNIISQEQLQQDAIDASVENEMFLLDNATEAEYRSATEFIQDASREEIDDYYAQFRQRFDSDGNRLLLHEDNVDFFREQEFDDPRNPDLGAEMMRQIGEEPEPRSRIKKAEIATFYSPLMSALDEAPISDKGTMGRNIMAFIRKRSPKMSEGELNYTGEFLEPNKKYTRQEAKDLAYEKGITVKAVINKEGNYEGTQRQRLSYNDYSEMEEGYVEILLEGNKNTYRGKDIDIRSHHNSSTLAHARLSHKVDLEEYNDAMYDAIQKAKPKEVRAGVFRKEPEYPDVSKFKEGNSFLLIEELQSDMLQKAGQSRAGQSPSKERLPINKDKDYLRNLLQSIFIYAKNNKIDYIVLPPVKKIREKRLDDLRTSSKDQGQKVFDVTYNKAFRKALKSLQDEYPKGTIQTREKKLKFMDVPNKDNISDKDFFMQNATENQIRNHTRMHPYDHVDQVQHNYARYRERFYEERFNTYAFKEEDISTETALEIDISDLLIGNTVPRLNKGGLIKKPGLMQRPS